VHLPDVAHETDCFSRVSCVTGQPSRAAVPRRPAPWTTSYLIDSTISPSAALMRAPCASVTISASTPPETRLFELGEREADAYQCYCAAGHEIGDGDTVLNVQFPSTSGGRVF
jgi:hypothetical protein